VVGYGHGPVFLASDPIGQTAHPAPSGKFYPDSLCHCVAHGVLFRFVDVMTMHSVFPSGNTYFSHTTATARNATASSAKRILADGERSPFRMRETVLFATPARLASSLLPVFVFRIARLIAAIRLSSSAMSRRCHAETLLTSGNRAGSLAPSFRAESRSPAIVETAVVNRRRVGSSGTAKPHGAAGSLNHGAIMGSRKPYGSPLGFGLVVQIINGANFSNS